LLNVLEINGMHDNHIPSSHCKSADDATNSMLQPILSLDFSVFFSARHEDYMGCKL